MALLTSIDPDHSGNGKETMAIENTPLSPADYGLPPRTRLERDPAGRICLIIDRKSRVIMKDARVILEKIEKIRAVEPDAEVMLMTRAPVCSKSLSCLADHLVPVAPLT